MSVTVMLLGSDVSSPNLMLQVQSSGEQGDVIINGVEFRTWDGVDPNNFRKKVYATDLDDGSLLYVQFNVDKQGLADPHYQWELIEGLFEEVVSHMSVVDTQLEAASTTDLGDGRTLYNNPRLGVSFIYPSDYRIDDYGSQKGRPEGQYSIGVQNSAGEVVFALNAVADDYSPMGRGGCCEPYIGSPIDVSEPILQLKEQIEEKLMSIFVLHSVDVDEVKGLKFLAVHGGFGEISLHTVYLIPSDHLQYTNFEFHGPWNLFTVQLDDEAGIDTFTQAEADFNRELFAPHGYSTDWTDYPEFDQEKIRAFEEIMRTVEFR